MIVFDCNFVEMVHSPPNSWLFSTWKSFAKGTPYREALTLGLEYCQTNKLTGWVADLRQAAVIDNEDTLWIQKYWIPKAQTSGITRVATILPQKIIPKMQLTRLNQDVYSSYSGGIAILVFDDMGDALAFAKNGSTKNALAYK